MIKHTYRPDAKSVVERLMGRFAVRLDVDKALNIEALSGDADERVAPVLGMDGLTAMLGDTLESYRLRFDPLDDDADLYQPMLVYGDQAVAVDVFVRRRGASGEA